MIKLLRGITWLMLACALVLFAVRWHRGRVPAEGVDLPIGAFSFSDVDGRTVTDRDFSGRVTLFACIFTDCTSSCPQITGAMARLQRDLVDLRDLRLASLTVDPEHDTPARFGDYAGRFATNRDRWYFLRGPWEATRRFVVDQLRLGVQQNDGAPAGDRVLHSSYILLIDRQGHIRGFYDGTSPEQVDRLAADARRMHGPDLPLVNAGLNLCTTLLLLLGYAAIRRRRVQLHRGLMIAAFTVSMAFLASYLYYHFGIKDGQPTRFTATGWPKTVYLAVLLSHTVLAAAVAVLAPLTLWLGFNAPGNAHRRLARWTLPVWLYVSVTGVIVYVMLYRVYPPS